MWTELYQSLRGTDEKMKENQECWQCAKCFSIELLTSIFCSKCGKKSKTANQSSIATGQTRRYTGIGAIIFTALVFLIGLNVLVERISPTKKQQPDSPPSVIASSTPEPKPELISYVSDSKSIEGKVIAILDGDTITILASDNKQVLMYLIHLKSF